MKPALHAEGQKSCTQGIQQQLNAIIYTALCDRSWDFVNKMLHVLFAAGCVSTLRITVVDDRPLQGSFLISLLHAAETKSSSSASGFTGLLKLWSVSYK